MRTEKSNNPNLKEFGKIMSSMDKTYNEDIIKSELDRDLDENHEWYEEMSVVDKPQYLVKKHANDEMKRQGISVSDELKPLSDMVIVAMEREKEKTDSGIYITRTNKQFESSIGFVVGLNNDSEYEFEFGDKVVINLNKVKGRYNYNGIRLILHKNEILGVFCD